MMICFRALLSVGYIFLTFWAGVDICAPDILLWNILLVILNLTHTALLTWRFLPPTLTLELTELYLKVCCNIIKESIILNTSLFCRFLSRLK